MFTLCLLTIFSSGFVFCNKLLFFQQIVFSYTQPITLHSDLILGGDSLAGGGVVTLKVRQQIATLLNVNRKRVEVEIAGSRSNRTVYCVLFGSNNCAMSEAAYMMDICLCQPILAALYMRTANFSATGSRKSAVRSPTPPPRLAAKTFSIRRN